MAKGLADIGAEAVLLAGGARAILLQIADPRVGRGVAEHSDFAAHPMARLRATMTYVYAVVYGTAEQRTAAVRGVNLAHGPVRAPAPGPGSGPAPGSGSGPGSGPAYSAFDPHLQLWVNATLYDTAVRVYERVFGPLDGASADRVYAEYACLGTALQMPASLWPADRAAFRRYWQGQSAALRCDEQTRRIAHQLLHPVHVPAWLRALMPLVRLVTSGLLPPELRAGFGLPWSGRRQRIYDVVMAATAAVYPRLPRRLRHGYRNHLLASAPSN